jgi:hypothetical protein
MLDRLRSRRPLPALLAVLLIAAALAGPTVAMPVDTDRDG